MALSTLLAHMSAAASPQYRAEFRAEQRCSIGFAGLRPVTRSFLRS